MSLSTCSVPCYFTHVAVFLNMPLCLCKNMIVEFMGIQYALTHKLTGEAHTQSLTHDRVWVSTPGETAGRPCGRGQSCLCSPSLPDTVLRLGRFEW